MIATEQARSEAVAPGYLKNIIVILSEMGLRYIDLENGLVHIADSKTVNGIGDRPLTQAAQEAFRRQMEETPGSEYLFPSPKLKA